MEESVRVSTGSIRHNTRKLLDSSKWNSIRQSSMAGIYYQANITAECRYAFHTYC